MDAFQVVEASGYVPHEWFHYAGGAVMAVISVVMVYYLVKK